MTVKELMEGSSCFTLHFDEAVMAKVEKQMDLLVWYKEARVKYLTSVMFGPAKTQDVGQKMLETLEELTIPVRLMLYLGMNGPNLNKSTMDKLNQFERVKGYQQLVNCPPSCLIHVCHNSFH